MNIKRKLLNEELNRPSPDEFAKAEKMPVVVVLDNLRSHNNIGSIFRTADAFAVEALYLCGITACPPHRDIHKTALGATDTVKWRYFDNTVSAVNHLKSKGYKIVAVEQVAGATLLHEFCVDSIQPLAIIFGHEIKGVDQQVIDLVDECVEIPQVGVKHSINVAVSAGIVIWEAFCSFTKIS